MSDFTTNPMNGPGHDFLTEPTLRLHDTHVMVSREELEGLRAEKARTDWLAQNCRQVIIRDSFVLVCDAWREYEGPDIIAAIDAARGAK